MWINETGLIADKDYICLGILTLVIKNQWK